MNHADFFADPATRMMYSFFNDRENDWSERPQYMSDTAGRTTRLFRPTDDFVMSSGAACCAVSQATAVWHRNVQSWYQSTSLDKSEHPPPSMNVADILRSHVLSNSKRNSPNIPPKSKEQRQPLRNTVSQKEEEPTSESSSAVTTDSRGARVLAKVVPPLTSHTKVPHDDGFVEARNATLLRLFVDDYSVDDFWSLLDDMKSNQVVEKVIIFRKRQDDGERTRSREDMDYLFRTLGNLSGMLTQLHLWNFLPKDLPSLSFGIVDQPSIMYLQLHMEFGSLDKTTVSAIASMKKLVSLELEVNSSFPVGDLLASESLVVVAVISDKFVFESQDILALAEKLETNSVLQVLDLEPRIPCWCLGSVMCSLNATTSSALETFEFSCRTSTTKEGDDCMNEIINTLQNEDSRLRVIWNHRYESFEVSNGMKMRTLNVLKSNKVVEHFHVFLESHGFCATKCEVLERKVKKKLRVGDKRDREREEK